MNCVLECGTESLERLWKLADWKTVGAAPLLVTTDNTAQGDQCWIENKTISDPRGGGLPHPILCS